MTGVSNGLCVTLTRTSTSAKC